MSDVTFVADACLFRALPRAPHFVRKASRRLACIGGRRCVDPRAPLTAVLSSSHQPNPQHSGMSLCQSFVATSDACCACGSKLNCAPLGLDDMEAQIGLCDILIASSTNPNDPVLERLRQVGAMLLMFSIFLLPILGAAPALPFRR